MNHNNFTKERKYRWRGFCWQKHRARIRSRYVDCKRITGWDRGDDGSVTKINAMDINRTTRVNATAEDQMVALYLLHWCESFSMRFPSQVAGISNTGFTRLSTLALDYTVTAVTGLMCCTEWTSEDMPHDTDYPYPIRILAVFKVIRPYSILIRILTNFMETICLTTLFLVCVTKLCSIMES